MFDGIGLIQCVNYFACMMYIYTAGTDGSKKHHMLHHHYGHANGNGNKDMVYRATSSLADVSETSWADDDEYNNNNNNNTNSSRNSNMMQQQQVNKLQQCTL
jgi:hypothetical protein